MVNSQVEKAAELYRDLQNWRTQIGAQMPYLKDETFGKQHFHTIEVNTPTKINMFEYQTGVTEGLLYDGEGTYMNINKNATLTYWLKIEKAGIYYVKVLCKNESSETVQILLTANGESIQMDIRQTAGWQEDSVQTITLPEGVYAITLKNTSNAIKIDKFVVADTHETLRHDGSSEETTIQTECAITFEDGLTTHYESIIGNSMHQQQTPIVAINPDKGGINLTDSCLYIRSNQDISNNIPGWFANNFIITLKETHEITDQNKYLHILHRKGQILNNWLIYGSNDGITYEELGRGTCTTANKWFDIVVDVSSKLTQLKYIRIHLDGNWTGSGSARYYAPTDFYYDELVLSNSYGARQQVTYTQNQTVTNNETLQLYPNPVTQWLSIKIGQPIRQICIYNTTGLQIASYAGNKLTQQQIDMAGWASGIYLIKIETENGIIQMKQIIKQ